MVRLRRPLYALEMLLCLGLVGCGGGGGGAATTGRLRVRVDWPSRGRYVPPYADSVLARVTVGLQQYQVTINRSGDQASVSTAQFGPSIPPGTFPLFVEAFEGPDGSGSKVAVANLNALVEVGQTTTLNVSGNLQSTIDHIVIEDQPVSVVEGRQSQLNGHAEDSANAVILLPPGALLWSVVAGTDHASITATGLLTAGTVGLATVRLYEPGAAKFVDATVDVISDRLILFVMDDPGNQEVYSMSVSGTNAVNITNSPGYDFDPWATPDGSKVVFTSSRSGFRQIYVMNTDGTAVTRNHAANADEDQPAVSPNGSRIAFHSYLTGSGDIYVMNLNGSGVARLTSTAFDEGNPCWSPDGQYIVFQKFNGPGRDIWMMDANGANQRMVYGGPNDDMGPVFSPDGAKILFHSLSVGISHLYVVNPDGSGLDQLTNLPSYDSDAAFDRSGSQILFSSNRSGNWEIHRLDLPARTVTQLTFGAEPEKVPVFLYR